MSNDRLRAAIRKAGLDPEQVADQLQVDVKTVDRWLAGRNPYSRHRTRLARLLGVDEQELWPDATPAAAADSTGGLELIGAYARTDDPLAPEWRTLLDDAEERIELLDYTLIDILSHDQTPALLKRKAQDGCEVRLLISYQSRARLATDTPIDEPYPDAEPAAAYDIARSRGYIQQLLDTDGIEARRFAAMRFNSVIRADDQMLVSLHLWGTPLGETPLIHLRASDHPRLFQQFTRHYEEIWQHASHPIDPEPDLFPDPDVNPECYDRLAFDDPPPDEHPGDASPEMS